MLYKVKTAASMWLVYWVFLFDGHMLRIVSVINASSLWLHAQRSVFVGL